MITVSVLVHHPPSLCNFRRRSYISGLNLKSVWRVWLELSHCLQVEKGSPAPPVTPVSITMTRPPAPHAHLGHILMGRNVLTTLLIYILFLLVYFPSVTFVFPNCVFLCVHPTACTQCPAGTEPSLGYEFKWWNILPPNMKTSCFNVGNNKCDNMNGGYFWQHKYV